MFDSKGTMQKVMLIGRLGQDVELKYTPSGVAVATVSIATNSSYKNQDGTFTDATEWHRVVMWRKMAENVAKFCKKGHRIYVEGKLITRQWNDKDGNKRYSTEITAEAVQFLEGKKEGEETQESNPWQPPASEPQAPPVADDDLPF